MSLSQKGKDQKELTSHAAEDALSVGVEIRVIRMETGREF